MTLINVTNETEIQLTAIRGDYTENSSRLTSKLIIIDSNLIRLPSKISTFFQNLDSFGAIRSNLKYVKRKDFVGMDLLKILDLRQNKISELPNDTFQDLSNLRKLDLSRNKLKSLSNISFLSMFYLTKFIVNENQIELFDFDIFNLNKKLEEIHLWRNQIKALRFDVKKFRKLTVVDLRENVCINNLFYLSTSESSSLQVQNEINSNCSSYVKHQGQLTFRSSRIPL